MQTLRPHPGSSAEFDKSNIVNQTGASFVPKSGGRPPAFPSTVLAKILAPGLICTALWSHIWIGAAAAVILMILTCVALFSSTLLVRNFGAQTSAFRMIAYGEKIWLNRLACPIPSHMSRQTTVLYLVFILGIGTAMTGSWFASPILTATGLIVCHASQYIYFVKLRQLYVLMKNSNPLYKSWDLSPVNDNAQTGIKPTTADIANQ
ncbi:MAG: DUF6653 family protein [Roseibium sp.]